MSLKEEVSLVLLPFVSLPCLASVLLKPSPFSAKGHVMLYINHCEWEECVNSKALSSSRDLKIGSTEHLGNVL